MLLRHFRTSCKIYTAPPLPTTCTKCTRAHDVWSTTGPQNVAAGNPTAAVVADRHHRFTDPTPTRRPTYGPRATHAWFDPTHRSVMVFAIGPANHLSAPIPTVPETIHARTTSPRDPVTATRRVRTTCSGSFSPSRCSVACASDRVEHERDGSPWAPYQSPHSLPQIVPLSYDVLHPKQHAAPVRQLRIRSRACCIALSSQAW